VEVVHGDARVVDGKTLGVDTGGGARVRIPCEHLLLAAGSEPVELPARPCGGNVLSSTGAVAPGRRPKRLDVVGAGD
ncbi:dihydrolipoyl dehydrogenase, partial [Burkholderia pseudomallei]